MNGDRARTAAPAATAVLVETAARAPNLTWEPTAVPMTIGVRARTAARAKTAETTPRVPGR